MRYSVLIRTFNSAKTLPATLHSLANQTNPPREFIFVDSGSTDRTLELLPEGSIVHHFIGSEFNYAGAINQGLDYVTTDYVMIVSSHTLLRNAGAADYALTLMSKSHNISAAYYCDGLTGDLEHELIDKTNFDGFNGVWNTCSIIKMSLLRIRRFRPEVFSAEDQEWSSWLFSCTNNAIARISGGGMDCSKNQNFHRLRKKMINEYVAIAYFANRNLLHWRNIAWVALCIVKPAPPRLGSRSMNFLIFLRLIACHFVQPRYASRYF